MLSDGKTDNSPAPVGGWYGKEGADAPPCGKQPHRGSVAVDDDVSNGRTAGVSAEECGLLALQSVSPWGKSTSVVDGVTREDPVLSLKDQPGGECLHSQC